MEQDRKNRSCHIWLQRERESQKREVFQPSLLIDIFRPKGFFVESSMVLSFCTGERESFANV